MKRNIAVDYLRAFVTLLVLAHHSVLAYHPYAPPPPSSLVAQPRWWQAFPVVDTHRWAGFSALVGFNDIFFMSLMFFLSGLFVWNSLQRKGSGKFLRDRLFRLGLPFLAAAAFIAPLAYYPAFLQTGAPSGFNGFWHQWLSLGNWPAGPAWFVWLLLAFDIVAALLFLLIPKWGEALGRLTAIGPAKLFALLVVVSAAVYVPLALAFNPFQWTAFGPFTFQTSRILHYFVYFAIAIGIGAYGTDRGLLAPDGKLARRWILWAMRALFAFALVSAIAIAAATSHAQSQSWAVWGDFLFTVSCAASSFAFLAIFVRFAQTRVRLFDSLSDNAYGMYLIHYAFVSWLQYAFLRAAMPAFAKGSIVFLATIALSWAATAALRRVPAIGRLI